MTDMASQHNNHYMTNAKQCESRESNPELLIGNQKCYRYTTNTYRMLSRITLFENVTGWTRTSNRLSSHGILSAIALHLAYDDVVKEKDGYLWELS